MKAGLMEIGDIFVINKSDRDGSEALGVALRTMLHLKMTKESDREVPVIKTVASRNKGIDELYDFIIMHKEYLEKKGMLEKKRKENPVKEPVENKKQKLTEQKSFDKRKKEVEEPVRTNNRFILYVSNLSSETTRTMLEAFFADCGALKSVRIPKKRLSHFAFVEMKDFEGYKVIGLLILSTSDSYI